MHLMRRLPLVLVAPALTSATLLSSPPVEPSPGLLIGYTEFRTDLPGGRYKLSAAIERLRFAVLTLPGALAGFSEAESEQRPSPERWTKKEVVGHLIDSASNNHQRFVRGQLTAGQDFPRYEQEQWVRIRGYQSARWSDLIDLWRAYNTHLLHVVGRMSEECNGRLAGSAAGPKSPWRGCSWITAPGDRAVHVQPGDDDPGAVPRTHRRDHRPDGTAVVGRGGRTRKRRGTVMQKINLAEKLTQFGEHWKPKVVGELNGQMVKLVKFQGPFVWHHHDQEDELFLVVKGRFRMEFRDRHVWLGEGEFLIVPRGVEHRPVADEEAHVLLFEPASTLNTGNVQNERTVAKLDRI